MTCEKCRAWDRKQEGQSSERRVCAPMTPVNTTYCEDLLLNTSSAGLTSLMPQRGRWEAGPGLPPEQGLRPRPGEEGMGWRKKTQRPSKQRALENKHKRREYSFKLCNIIIDGVVCEYSRRTNAFSWLMFCPAILLKLYNRFRWVRSSHKVREHLMRNVWVQNEIFELRLQT